MGIGTHSGAIWGIILAYLILSCFGYAYNRLVGYLQREKLDEGFVWLEVVVGVAVTTGVMFLALWGRTFDVYSLLAIFGGFVMSGSWMAGGALVRYIQGRQAAQRVLRQEVQRAWPTSRKAGRTPRS